VVLDSVAVLDGRKVRRRFREVEVELVGTVTTVLERRALLRAGGAAESQGRRRSSGRWGSTSLEVKPPGPSATP
jgi:hypothetical protein